MEVIKILESPKNQEMKLAQQVKEMLPESSTSRGSDEELTTNWPFLKRYYFCSFDALLMLLVCGHTDRQCRN